MSVKRLLKQYLWDIVAGALALALGWLAASTFARADDNALRVLLSPHAKMAEWFYNISLSYQNGIGYVYSDAFSIGASCMGMNFIVMLFCMCVCVFSHKFTSWRKPVFFAAAAIGSVIIGVFISCIRIIGSIPLVNRSQFYALHTGIGAAFYLAALTGVYIILSKLTGGLHEKHS